MSFTSTEQTAAIENKLDLLIGMLRVAFREPLAAERAELLVDPVNKAILKSLARGPVEAGELKERVGAETKSSKPTVERRIADLAARGVLRRIGSGAQVSYSSTGLIEP